MKEPGSDPRALAHSRDGLAGETAGDDALVLTNRSAAMSVTTLLAGIPGTTTGLTRDCPEEHWLRAG